MDGPEIRADRYSGNIHYNPKVSKAGSSLSLLFSCSSSSSSSGSNNSSVSDRTKTTVDQATSNR